MFGTVVMNKLIQSQVETNRFLLRFLPKSSLIEQEFRSTEFHQSLLDRFMMLRQVDKQRYVNDLSTLSKPIVGV